jgi:putative copper export protein
VSWGGKALIVVVALGVVAAAFLLPRSDGNDFQRAAAKAARLHNVRLTMSLEGHATVEDFVAPDRTRRVIHLGSYDIQIFEIGS